MTARYIGKYEIISTLGRGSMGVVYKGRDPEIGRLVAIKTLKSVYLGEDVQGAEALKRFRQESRSAGKLTHPNIVTIFEAGRTDNGSPYIVMGYVEGKSLEALLTEKGALEVGLVVHFMAQLAGAIDYAHSQSVIHRDIKPSNILVDSENRPYLLDFGVAKISDTSLTPAGTVVGTPGYMSPEQIRGAQLDGRTDLFSLAVVCFELFTGKRPFPGNDFTTVVGNIVHKEPLSFKELKVSLPKDLEVVLRKALSKDRNLRFESAMSFVRELARVTNLNIEATGLVGGYVPLRNGEAGEDKNLDLEEVGDKTVISENLIAEVKQREINLQENVFKEKSWFRVGKLSGKILIVVVVLGILIAVIKIAFPEKISRWKELIEDYKQEISVPSSGVKQEVLPLQTKKKILKPDEVTEATVKSLSDMQLVELLGSIVEPKALQIIITESISRNQPTLAQALIPLTMHQAFSVRIACLRALNSPLFLQNQQIVDAIIARLEDNDELVRAFAVKVLSSLENPIVRESFLKLQAKEQSEVVKKQLSLALSAK